MHRFLKNVGINPHQMSFELSPSGQGSAEQWVRENFARQAGKCRARNTRAATGMFIMLDADRHTVQERLQVLDDALVCANQKPIDPSRDCIARLIPKRNVETWIIYLDAGENAQPVDEQTDYKQTKSPEEWSALIPHASETLSSHIKHPAAIPADLIDSLRHGLREIPRALSTER